MAENGLKNIMDITLDKLRASVDADVVIGTPIVVDNLTLIPVSKASFGIAAGGSDMPLKSPTGFLGGSGAGVSITPVAFIAVKDGNPHIMPIYTEMSTADKALNMAPELIDKIKTFFKSENNK